MNHGGTLSFRSDVLVEYLAPTNAQTGAFIDSGTCTAYVFHDRKDTTLAVAALSSDTVLAVADARKWVIGDQAYVLLETNAWFDAGAVTAVDADANTLTVTNGLSADVRKGRPVRAILGDPVSMTAFGTPAAGTREWGFRGVLPDTQDDLELGMAIRIEIDLDAGDGLHVVEVLHATVTDGS